MTSGRWSGGGGLFDCGISSFTAWVMMGSDTIRVTSNTSMTSISGVVLMSHMAAPDLLPILIAISSILPALARRTDAVVGLGEEAHLDDAATLERVKD